MAQVTREEMVAAAYLLVDKAIGQVGTALDGAQNGYRTGAGEMVADLKAVLEAMEAAASLMARAIGGDDLVKLTLTLRRVLEGQVTIPPGYADRTKARDTGDLPMLDPGVRIPGWDKGSH